MGPFIQHENMGPFSSQIRREGTVVIIPGDLGTQLLPLQSSTLCGHIPNTRDQVSEVDDLPRTGSKKVRRLLILYDSCRGINLQCE